MENQANGSRNGQDNDTAFQAVERVLTGAVTKVLSQYHQPPPRGKRQHRPEIESSDEEDFTPPPKKKCPKR